MPSSLSTVCAALDSVAPLRLAADWDKTGLLVEPLRQRPIRRVLCAIDFTAPVVDEALAAGTDLVVAYHPPIFRGLSGVRASEPDELVIVRCLEEGLAVWSPHTAWDAVVGGATDWLCDGLGLTETERRAIEPSDSEDPPSGHGRVLTLETPVALDSLIGPMKALLGLDRLRVARGARDSGIRRIAVCPGAGSSVLARVADADLWWTGEMRHHDLLGALSRGQSVVLSEHSSTERGSLRRFAERLRAQLPNLEVECSKVDRDPLSWE